MEVLAAIAAVLFLLHVLSTGRRELKRAERFIRSIENSGPNAIAYKAWNGEVRFH